VNARDDTSGGNVLLIAIYSDSNTECGSRLVVLHSPRFSNPLAKFPGGKIEPTDTSVRFAMRREAIGETGLDIDEAEKVCELPPVLTTGPGGGYRVYFFVAWFNTEYVHKKLLSTGDEGEIVFTVPLDHFESAGSEFLPKHRCLLEMASASTGYVVHDALFGSCAAEV
jgi:8-oxo-dGTP pyrophosphatase MutT (NUDIX family)